MTLLRYQTPRPTLDPLQFLDNALGTLSAPEIRGFNPAVDISENDDALVFRVDLPGMKQEDIEIELNGDQLVLRGERRTEEGQRNLHVERTFGRFARTFTLKATIQHDLVAASYRDGVLEVVLPKSEAAKPRKIAVQTEA